MTTKPNPGFFIEQLKQDLRSKSTKELEQQIESLTDCQSRGVRDELLLSLCENEMERRFLVWEAR